jgi:hypothetical protein
LHPVDLRDDFLHWLYKGYTYLLQQFILVATGIFLGLNFAQLTYIRNENQEAGYLFPQTINNIDLKITVWSILTRYL